MIFKCNTNHEILQTYDHVVSWTRNRVRWSNGGYGVEEYCGEGEYFTDDPARDAEPSMQERIDELEARSAEYDEYFADIIYEMSMSELGLEGGEI